jgi:pyrroloquinoline quinone (PQQ) biosynthesis protein C
MAKHGLKLKKRFKAKSKTVPQKLKAVEAVSGPRRYSPEEAQKIVDQAWEISLKDAFKRVWEHPFTRELDAGTLPMEVIRGFMCNWYTAAQEINASSASGFYANRQLYSRIPELEDARAEGTADEFSAPGPGGHQRTIEGVARALGISREELINYPLIPEARAYLDSLVCVLSEPSRAGAFNAAEERLAEWFKIWSRSLVEHYGLKPEDVFYFTMHAEADSRDQHYGGPVIGDEVMGHAERNRYVARRILEEGLGPPDPLTLWPQISRWATDGFLLLLDGCYERYYPQARSQQALNQ